jgi:predicted MFS family arabinose efflux permease
VTARPVALGPEVLPLARDAVLERRDGGHAVSYRLALPYFGWLWAPFVRRRARAIERAADAGERLPSGQPWWAPPVALDESTATAVGAICLLSLVWSYAGGTGGLLTATLPYAADVYHVGDRELGIGLAIVRAGVVAALPLALLVDRRGRRRFVVAATLAHCVFAALLGLAPDFEVYVGGHLLLRCLDTALAVGLAVLVVETVPAGSRGMALSGVILAAAAGSAIGILALPLADAGRGGFAAAYALGLLAIPFVLDAGRRLAESRRYLAHAREPHRYRELLSGRYRGRMAALGAAIFAGAVFTAPGVEFFNRYLDDVRGFSSLELVLFLTVTGAPAAPMVLAGGRVADVVGRKRVGVPLLAVAAACLAGFYLTPEPWIWPLALLAQMAAAGGGAALAPYASELFPTRVRSAAGTLTRVLAVAGGAAGLVAAGLLSDSLDIGPSVAALIAFPALALVIVAFRFPETARAELEETSGEAAEAPA